MESQQCDEIECEHDYREVEPDVNVCQRCGDYLPIWDDEMEYDGRGDEPLTVEGSNDV